MGLYAPYLTHILGSIPELVRTQGIGGVLVIVLEELYAYRALVNSPLRLLLVSWVGHIEKVYPYL